MTLYELIYTIKNIALKQPNVRTFGEGNIYDILNANPSVEYDAVILTQGTHAQDDKFNYFNFNLFYVSRLVDNLENNRLQIQSISIGVLSNIVQFLSDAYDIELNGNITFNTFTEKFADECAGCYCKITLVVEKETYCGEVY
jgi:hypothetical protein